jgi:hypothetical protein
MDLIKKIFTTLIGDKKPHTTGLQEVLVDVNLSSIIEMEEQVEEEVDEDNHSEFIKGVFEAASGGLSNGERYVTNESLHFDMFTKRHEYTDDDGNSVSVQIWCFSMNHPYAKMLRKNNSISLREYGDPRYPAFFELPKFGICAYTNYFIEEVIENVKELCVEYNYPVK